MVNQFTYGLQMIKAAVGALPSVAFQVSFELLETIAANAVAHKPHTFRPESFPKVLPKHSLDGEIFSGMRADNAFASIVGHIHVTAPARRQHQAAMLTTVGPYGGHVRSTTPS